MNTGTLVGNILALFLLLMAIMFDFNTFTLTPSAIKYFIDFPSLLIVLGGAIASTFISYPMDQAKTFGKLIGKAWKEPNVQLVETLTLIVDVSKIARKNILAIEDALPSIENEFLRGGLRLVVDRVDRQLIVDMLAHEMKYTEAQSDGDIAVIKTLASLAPAWGMLGTLVGLVILLQNLDDPSKIGPAMAVALITTLYGSLFANVIFAPTATKLGGFKGDEKLLMEMIRDGVLYIERGERPDFIEGDLMNYLPSSQKQMYEQLKFENEQKGGSGGGGGE
ncbi:MAG: MotA/TolQ/ExbB proton channel family protein [SAR324 cluster bacterium]|nr:MotA/TolQ/ExbB proton channel family protein [SAR324 cluster bacterium]